MEGNGMEVVQTKQEGHNFSIPQETQLTTGEVLYKTTKDVRKT